MNDLEWAALVEAQFNYWWNSSAHIDHPDIRDVAWDAWRTASGLTLERQEAERGENR